jgi:D-glycero-alpha-D-manno-heptose-7-phosphate kinase
MIRSRAPVRIDFAGGWTDVALFAQEQPGAVVNAAINIYSYATARKNISSNEVKDQPKEAESGEYGGRDPKAIEGNLIRIYSVDFDIYEEAAEIKQLEYDGNIDLVKAAIKRMDADFGLEIITRSNAPAGSGLGSSASMGVALVGALARLVDSTLLPYEYAEIASSIERHELGILGGKQDQYASAIGGVNFMEFSGEDVKLSKLPLPAGTLYELEKNLVLCYTGKSRLSSNIHQNVVDAYLAGCKDTLDALRNLKQIAVEMKNALLKGDLLHFGTLLNDNWDNQKRLHTSVTNPEIDSLFDLALGNGAIGGKASGAGGGGCLVFYCAGDQEHAVRRKLQDASCDVIDFNFDFEGLQTWVASY